MKLSQVKALAAKAQTQMETHVDKICEVYGTIQEIGGLADSLHYVLDSVRENLGGPLEDYEEADARFTREFTISLKLVPCVDALLNLYPEYIKYSKKAEKNVGYVEYTITVEATIDIVLEEPKTVVNGKALVKGKAFKGKPRISNK